MSVDRTEIARIAALARLEMHEEQLERMVHDLNTILDHVEALAELDAMREGEETSFFAELAPSREAEETDRPGVEDVGALAPSWREGFFLVPPPPGLGHDGEEA